MSIRRLTVFSVGNPGPMNRHSAGHFILNKLAERFNIDINQQSSTYSSGQNDNLTLVKSSTFMNESGKALRNYLQTAGSDDQSLIILYDDFELNTGRVRLAPLKTPESHNGLSSCLKVLASSRNSAIDPKYIFKLGIGIGPKPKGASSLTMGTWVLSRFKQHELAQLTVETLPIVEDYLKFIEDEDVKSVPEETSRANKIHSRKIQRGEYPKA